MTELGTVILIVIYFVIGFVIAVIDEIKAGKKQTATIETDEEKGLITNAAQLEMVEFALLIIVLFWPVYLFFHIIKKKQVA